MINFILFWIAKAIAELAIFIFIFTLIYVLFFLPEKIKQLRCSHGSYTETISCDAICKKCGKNLGFIGNIRDKKENNNA